MMTYCIVLASVHGLAIVFNEDERSRITIFINILIFAPIWGRIWGWW